MAATPKGVRVGLLIALSVVSSRAATTDVTPGTCSGEEQGDEMGALQIQAMRGCENEYTFAFSGWSIYIDAEFCNPDSGINPVFCEAQRKALSKCPGADNFPGHMTIIYNVGGPLFVDCMAGKIAEIIEENDFKPFNVSVELDAVDYENSTAGAGWTFGDWYPYEMRYLQLNIAGEGELLRLTNAITSKFGGGDAAAEGGYHPHFSMIYLPLNDPCFTAEDARQLFEELPTLDDVKIPVTAVTIMNTTGKTSQWKVVSKVELTR